MPRKDLAKALCEDGRRGSRDYMGGNKGFEKDHKFRNAEDREEEYSDLESLPKRESMKYRLRGDWDGGRQFSENLAPLYGLIHKHVGKNWDKLYSEICELAPPNGSNIFRHVHQHLHDYIGTNTQLCADGTIQVNRYDGWYSPESAGYDYYVHPTSRCIIRVDPSKKVSRYAHLKSWLPAHVPLADICRVTESELYVKFYGIWYVYRLVEPIIGTKKVWNEQHACFAAVDYCTNPDQLATDIAEKQYKNGKKAKSRHTEADPIGWDSYHVDAATRLHPNQNARDCQQASGPKLKKMGLTNDKKETK